MEVILFLNGIVFFYFKNPLSWIFLCSVCFIRRRLVFVVVFLAGLGWAALHQVWIHPQGMPANASCQHAHLFGEVHSIPTHTETKTQFQFLATRLNHQPVHVNIMISCYQHCPSNIQLGQRWSLTANLYKPRDYANPGGFRFVDWLAARHIAWLGIMQDAKQHHPIAPDKPPLILNFRHLLAQKLEKLGLNESSLGVVQALALGMTANLDQSLWALFRRTGTTHLMVISGAHIGLMSGFGFFITKWLWCRLDYFCLRKPAQQAGAWVGMVFALAYALLAGFAVPAQRSCVACCVMLSRYFLPQRFSAWQAWRYALWVVLCLEPHAVCLSGFYLSFTAVAILLVMNQWLQCTKLRKLMGIQLACLVGLMPLTLYWFSYAAVNGFLANLLAIPWVGFIIVPLSLTTALLSEWGSMSYLVWALNHAIAGLLYYLRAVDALSWMNLSVAYADMIKPLAWLVAIGLVLFLPVRAFALVTSLFLFIGLYPKHDAIKLGEAKLDILDVGQGLAIMIRTQNHQMLYDTGMKFYHGSDMGNLVILPYLKLLGTTRLDKVVISHPDLDHRGGLKSIAEVMPIDELIVDNPRVYRHALSCHHYPDWDWDGIHFHFFQIKTNLHSKNNTSCVLQLKTKQGKILLPGDIEKKAEMYLVMNYGKQLQSNLIVVPHHGSKTSSTELFLKTVKPNQAILSYGFDNRYHFPHASVVDRYRSMHVELYNTVDCGMVSVSLGQGGLLAPTCYR